ncbi:MAG: hypothetical protein ACI97A_002710 [Planctomycetota bacterium]|jgi:hypothetical protein
MVLQNCQQRAVDQSRSRSFRAMRSFLSVGIACVLLASIASAQFTLAHTLAADSFSDRLGSSVAGIGEVNGDFRDDFVAGAPHDDNNGADSGSARVYSGIDGSTLFTFNGDAAGDHFGAALSGAGDVNGDGVNDIIVGAPDANFGTGLARVFSGATGAVIHTVYGVTFFDAFGTSVSGAGDVNGDGFDDFIVGASLGDDTSDMNNIDFDTGAAYIFSGMTGLVLHSIFGDSAGDEFGCSVSGAGDVNGDGFSDVVVGAHFDDNNGINSGSVRILDGNTGITIFTFDGDAAGDELGGSVSYAGDVNDDDYGDVIAGASGADAARVYSGVDGTIVHTLTRGAIGIQFGSAVSGAGDVNADGFDDLIVGAQSDFVFGENSGSVSIFSGVDGSFIQILFGSSSQERFGVSVGAAGDTNADGFDDILVGSPLSFPLGNARVFHAPFLPVLIYQSDLADSRLKLRWLPDGGGINSLTGTVTCDNATPGAFGHFGLSLAPANILIYGFPLLLAIDSINLIDTGNFGFGFFGEIVFPNVSRQNPFLAGSFVFIQLFEVSPIPASSNGLALLISP